MTTAGGPRVAGGTAPDRLGDGARTFQGAPVIAGPHPVRRADGHPGPPARRRGDLVLFTLAVGLGGPVIGLAAFAAAATVRRSSALAAATVGYGAVGLVGVAGLTAGSFLVAGPVAVLLWLVMYCHAVCLVSTVADERRAGEQPADRTGYRPTADPAATATATWERSRRLRQQARALADGNPVQALDLLVGRVDVPPARRPYPDGGLVDVNNVVPAHLVTYLGLAAADAARFAVVRADLGGFRGVEDLCSCFGMAPQHLDAVTDRLVFLPMLPWSRVATGVPAGPAGATVSGGTVPGGTPAG